MIANCLWVLCLLFFQNHPDRVDEAIFVMKTGNAKEMVKYFDSNAEIQWKGNKKKYNETEVEAFLRSFFKSYPIEKFSLIHKGSSSTVLKYAICEYQSAQDTFRMVLIFKKIKEKFMISKMNIKVA